MRFQLNLLSALFAVVALLSGCRKSVADNLDTGPLSPPVRQGETYASHLDFCGYRWFVKASQGKVGPGPNLFSTSNSFVDTSGGLHLRIDKSGCAEVVCNKSLGYGRYAFTVSSSPDIDPNSTFGLFTWSDAAPYHHREIDIEIGRWGKSDNKNCQMVVQPYNVKANIHRFDVPLKCKDFVCNFTWKPNEVDYSIVDSVGGKVESWIYSGPDVPKAGDERTHINLWICDGTALRDKATQEVVLKSFKFTSPF